MNVKKGVFLFSQYCIQCVFHYFSVTYSLFPHFSGHFRLFQTVGNRNDIVAPVIEYSNSAPLHCDGKTVYYGLIILPTILCGCVTLCVLKNSIAALCSSILSPYSQGVGLPLHLAATRLLQLGTRFWKPGIIFFIA